MKAIVKSRAERGLSIEDVPVPEVGINDVLIRVLMTGICGTDLHIYEWDEWAQATIPVPMAIGHEFVGEIVEVGSNVNDFQPGRYRQRRRPRGVRTLPQLSGRTAASVRAHAGSGRESAGAFAEYIALPMTQYLAASLRRSIWMSRRFSIRSGMRCTRRSRFRCWARMC